MSDFNKVIKWFCDNSLLINESKTKYMIFQLRIRETANDLLNTVGTFTPIDCHKDLGIFFDCRLSYIYHISYVMHQIKRKAAFTCRYLSRISDNYVLTSWFHAIFVSFFVYGIQLYSSGSISYLNSLESTWQRTIWKINSFCAGRHSDKNSNFLDLPSFSELLKKHDLNIISKYIKGDLPTETLSFNVPQYNSCRTNLIFLPTKRLEKTFRSFWNRAARTFTDYYLLE